MTSFAMYPSIIEAFGQYWFLTYPFKISMYLSNGYIHLKNPTHIIEFSLLDELSNEACYKKMRVENTFPIDIIV